MTPFRLKDQLTKVHGDKKNMDLDYFLTLIEKLSQQPTETKLNCNLPRIIIR